MTKPDLKISAKEVRTNVYESIATIVSALASPARLKIIQVLAQAEFGVEELSQQTGESVANVSQHLQRLARAKLVHCERRGLHRIYKASNPSVLQVWEDLQNLAHEVDEDLNHKEDFLTDSSLASAEEPVEVFNLVKNGKAILLDARDEKESSMTKVKGAIAIPVDYLVKTKDFKTLGLQKSKPIYVYCRGRYCSLATDAVKHLRSHGYKAFRLRESPYQLTVIQGGHA